MAVYRVNEGVKEVKWNRKKARRLSMRSMVPPSPAEVNEYDPLLTPQSYNNYGNPKPFGVSDGNSSGADAGATSTAGSSPAS